MMTQHDPSLKDCQETRETSFWYFRIHGNQSGNTISLKSYSLSVCMCLGISDRVDVHVSRCVWSNVCTIDCVLIRRCTFTRVCTCVCMCVCVCASDYACTNELVCYDGWVCWSKSVYEYMDAHVSLNVGIIGDVIEFNSCHRLDSSWDVRSIIQSRVCCNWAVIFEMFSECSEGLISASWIQSRHLFRLYRPPVNHNGTHLLI